MYYERQKIMKERKICVEGSSGMRGVGFNPFTPGLHTWFDT